MFYMYILKSLSNSRAYIGCTSDLRKRVVEHNTRQERSTKAGFPWKLIYYEAFSSISFARQREAKLKRYGKRWSELKKRIGFDSA
ncbi:MAG: GIY-YIG nuclease family protein [Candidatus Niyogibacteria bacterium]|nr:GIY-YIG nuclease family protein [Candidatus Niyogibacteria bacterium]